MEKKEKTGLTPPFQFKDDATLMSNIELFDPQKDDYHVFIEKMNTDVIIAATAPNSKLASMLAGLSGSSSSI